MKDNYIFSFEEIKEISKLYTEISRLGNNIITNSYHNNDINITREDWDILYLLYKNNGLTQKEISVKLNKNRASITSSINHLEKKGLVTRALNVHDKRSNNIYLTKLAREIKGNLFDITDKVIRDIFKGLTREEYENLMLILNKLLNNIQNIK